MKKKILYLTGGIAVLALMVINAEVVFNNNSDSYVNLIPISKTFASESGGSGSGSGTNCPSSKCSPIISTSANGNSSVVGRCTYIPKKSTTTCINVNSESCTSGTSSDDGKICL